MLGTVHVRYMPIYRARAQRAARACGAARRAGPQADQVMRTLLLLLGLTIARGKSFSHFHAVPASFEPAAPRALRRRFCRLHGIEIEFPQPER